MLANFPSDLKDLIYIFLRFGCGGIGVVGGKGWEREEEGRQESEVRGEG